MNLVILSNKRYSTDFRKYLIRAARRAGDQALHIYINEKFIVTYDDIERSNDEVTASPDLLYTKVNTYLNKGSSIVLTGLGGYRSIQALQAKQYIENAFFVYDVYDDFRYERKGCDLLRAYANDLRWRFYCDKQIILEKGMQRLYPRALHINNASHLSSLADSQETSDSRIIYIGSIDKRVDFAVLRAVGAQGNSMLDIYGDVHCHSLGLYDELHTLQRDCPSISYKGKYDNDDLPQILRAYQIGLVPYVVGSHLTQHVNPDKLYHYLNAGLEVIATPIPQAKRLGSFLHLLERCEDWPLVLLSARNEPKAGDHWPSNEFSWSKRWEELCAHING